MGLSRLTLGWGVSSKDYSLSLGALEQLDKKNHSLGFTVFGPLGGGSGIKRGMAPSITCIGMIRVTRMVIIIKADPEF